MAAIRSGVRAAGSERVGKYEILKHIATGGMAEIHLARAVGIEGFEKLVVLKRILPQFSANGEFVQMFLDEARIAATLHHSNIVQVYDIGSVRGTYFFAMEFLQGEDVRRVMETTLADGRKLPLEHAIQIILGACAGLHYAHEKVGLHGEPLNLVHRDVSPQNIFITYDGGVKLVDFGIAKASHRLNETRQGTLKGKVSYMSPEQCRSAVIDRRSDVFAIAIMLWELSTSHRLFRGHGEFDTMKMIVEGEIPSPRTIMRDYPVELERIVMKGLERKREDRYQTAQELQLDLEAFAREQRLVVSPVGLARYMRELFGEKIVAWLDAQKQGKLYPDNVEAFPSAPGTGELAAYAGEESPVDGDFQYDSGEGSLDMESEVQFGGLVVSRRRFWRGVLATVSAACALGMLVAAVMLKKPASATVTVPAPQLAQPAARPSTIAGTARQPGGPSLAAGLPSTALPATTAVPVTTGGPGPTTAPGTTTAPGATNGPGSTSTHGTTDPLLRPSTAHGKADARGPDVHRTAKRRVAREPTPRAWNPDDPLPP